MRQIMRTENTGKKCFVCGKENGFTKGKECVHCGADEHSGIHCKKTCLQYLQEAGSEDQSTGHTEGKADRDTDPMTLLRSCRKKHKKIPL